MRDSSGRFEFSVHPQGKTPADEYWHNGNVFIEGRDNSTYTLRFTNHFNKRVLAIFGVDGLCVQTGKPAGFASPGYVINPSQVLEIPGWSLNMNQAAEFYFSRKEDSFVNSIGGNVSNAGVIGCMVFEEAQPLTPVFRTFNAVQPTFGTNTSYTAGGIVSASVTNELGTGIGNTVDFNVVGTQFNRLTPQVPQALMVIYYNSAKNLQKMGIQLKTKRFDTYNPNPFPGSYGVFSGKSS